MIKEITIFNKKFASIEYEYLLYAFETDKGLFTLVGSDKNGTDTFKNLKTKEYHEWSRKEIYQWFVGGKISPVQESLTIDWYMYSNNNKNTVKRR